MNKFERGERVLVKCYVSEEEKKTDKVEGTIVSYSPDKDEGYLYTVRISNWRRLGLRTAYVTRVPERYISVDICAFDFERLLPVKIIYNVPATIVFWNDGTKTTVKCGNGERYNKYHGFCAALAKRIYKTNSQVNRIVNSGIDHAKKPKLEDGETAFKALVDEITTMHKKHYSYAKIAEKLDMPIESVKEIVKKERAKCKNK